MVLSYTLVAVTSILFVLLDACPTGICTFPLKSTVAFLLASVSGSCVILQVTALLANPVVVTTACNCTSNPALAEASLGLTVTPVTAGVSVVNTTAPLNPLRMNNLGKIHHQLLQLVYLLMLVILLQ